MGRQLFKRGFKATYLVHDPTGAKSRTEDVAPESTLFIAIFDSSDEAERALKDFAELLAKKKHIQPTVQAPPGFDTLKGDDAYQGEFIVVRKGSHLAGAAGFPSEKHALELLGQLTSHIE
jgi:hypothetical protein